jgi:hypothetical protein
MHYSATFPYSTSLPFEATLTDDGVVTCWTSTTYDQHNKQQIAFSNHRHARPNALQQIQVEPISLTEEMGVAGNMKNENGVEMTKRGDDGGQVGEEDVKNIWLQWEFTCLEGYQAHAGIGLRAVWYSAHGQEFEFVPQSEEDVLGNRWVYSIDLWCQ